MEALKIVLVIALCLFVIIIVCTIIKSETVCTHDSTLDPGPSLVTMDQFVEHCDHNGNEMKVVASQINEIHDVLIGQRRINAAQITVNDAQQESDKAILAGMKVYGDGLIETTRGIKANREYIKQIADGMTKLMETMIKAVER